MPETNVGAGRTNTMIMMTRFVSFMIVIFFCIPHVGWSAHEAIQDIRELKQDHHAYLDISMPETLMMDLQRQKQRDQDYNNRHFSPWHRTQPRSTLNDIAFEFEKYEKNQGYGKNGRKHGPGWIKRFRANAGLQDYSGAGHVAITIRHSSLRALPTGEAHFNSPEQALSGHPFDNLQATTVIVNTPVLISHVSRDKKWVWAETGYYFGWMRARDVAALPDDFMKKWETGRYSVILKDKTPLYSAEGLFLFRAPLGAVFPAVNDGPAGMEILVAVAKADRLAVLKKVILPKDVAAAKPVPMTRAQMARVANELIKEPYGWGGLNGFRDCSAMIRDLFAPFGIWLPRNSTEQAFEGGRFIDLSTLSAEAKEHKIVTEGIPYLTLLWRKGHIMLYMGVHDAEPLVFHNLWGISTRTNANRTGKLIVGHAAITTLHPGRELPDFHKEAADLSTNILGMTLLVEPPERQALQDR